LGENLTNERKLKWQNLISISRFYSQIPSTEINRHNTRQWQSNIFYDYKKRFRQWQMLWSRYTRRHKGEIYMSIQLYMSISNYLRGVLYYDTDFCLNNSKLSVWEIFGEVTRRRNSSKPRYLYRVIRVLNGPKFYASFIHRRVAHMIVMLNATPHKNKDHTLIVTRCKFKHSTKKSPKAIIHFAIFFHKLREL